MSLSDYCHANISMVWQCMKKLTQCHLQKTGMFNFEFSIYDCEKHTTIWMFTAVLLIVCNQVFKKKKDISSSKITIIHAVQQNAQV